MKPQSLNTNSQGVKPLSSWELYKFELLYWINFEYCEGVADRPLATEQQTLKIPPAVDKNMCESRVPKHTQYIT